ncbi:DNA polymerase III subunit chi [Sphingomonas lenta]|uniref:DNA polymerase III subunit chi n=1 Tax=Sphingomonas lenta TaxID=1141887 RepID=A0A2A2SGU9_9SPHN|nr:DNA polymerase III subunit chi [Sphingomonas lenta]PAX08410.1 DNA polymerase III subunit chi [Sphingomonas lenta]
MQVDFYHLTATPLERVLPVIAERVLAGGGRLLIVDADEGRRERLDRVLWEYARDSFLPHALAGAGEDAGQPALIAPEPEAGNDARNVALADGRWRDEALGFERAFLFFDEERVADARTAWKSLAEREGVTRNYWKQKPGGSWEKAA